MKVAKMLDFIGNKKVSEKYDLTFWSLLITNIITIFIALVEKWNLSVVIWIYWSQSVIIGLFTFFRIIALKKPVNLKKKAEKNIDSKKQTELTETQLFYLNKFMVAPFFLFHYGAFHLVYFVFLIFMFKVNLYYVMTILIVAALFFLNHLISFLLNLKKDNEEKKDAGELMAFAYKRIMPMHIIIIFGSFILDLCNNQFLVLLLFMALKTVADIKMHQIQHEKKTAYFQK